MAPQLSNTALMYGGLFDAMVLNYRRGNFQQSEKIAQDLLMHADLPGVIRGRCHMVLATGGEGFLGHAKAAVTVLEDVKSRKLVPDEEFPNGWLEDAREILKEAEEDDKKMREMAEAQLAVEPSTEEAEIAGEGAVEAETAGAPDMTEADKSAITAALSGTIQATGGLPTPFISSDQPGEDDEVRRDLDKSAREGSGPG